MCNNPVTLEKLKGTDEKQGPILCLNQLFWTPKSGSDYEHLDKKRSTTRP